MGYLSSGTTIYARAYLTEKGRNYLFNDTNVRFDSLGNDLFRITSFTLGDPDVNYNATQVLPEGQVPDVSGKYDTCLKTALDYQQRNLLFYQNFDQLIANNVDYATDANANILNVNVNLNDNDLPTGTDGNLPSTTGGGSSSTATFPTTRDDVRTQSGGSSSSRNSSGGGSGTFLNPSSGNGGSGPK